MSLPKKARHAAVRKTVAQKAAAKAKTAAKVQALSPTARASYAAGQRKASQKRAAVRAHHASARAAGLSPSLDYAGCTVAALADSLLLCSSLAAAELELRALFRAAGGSDEHGAYLSDVLAAVSERGLGGAWLRSAEPLDLQELPDVPLLLTIELDGEWAHSLSAMPSELAGGRQAGSACALQGAVTQALGPAGWLTGPRVTEAWQVSWAW